MNTFFTIVVLTFVFAVLALIVFALFELTPLARDANPFRDPRTGARRWESPHLD